jgi:hypothetical protein
MATLTSSGGDVVTFRIKTDSRSSVPYGFEPDRVDEQDLLGSARTMITRLGYGSKEINMDIILDTNADLQKLLSARSGTVTYGGSDYSLTITGDITKFGGHNMYEASIRLKAV